MNFALFSEILSVIIKNKESNFQNLFENIAILRAVQSCVDPHLK